MMIGIFGEHCSGKSTLAAAIQQAVGGEIVSGLDYLRMAKSESEAKTLFRARLRDAVQGGNVIYVIAQREHLDLLPEGAIRVLVTADLDTVKERFTARMRGNLPGPVAQMLERNHGMFDDVPHEDAFDGVNGDAAALCEALRTRLRDQADGQ